MCCCFFIIFFFLYGRCVICFFFFFKAEDGIRDFHVTGVQTCALPILMTQRCGRGRPPVADRPLAGRYDRKSVVQGKSVDLGGRRIIKKKKKKKKERKKEKAKNNKNKKHHINKQETS